MADKTQSAPTSEAAVLLSALSSECDRVLNQGFNMKNGVYEWGMAADPIARLLGATGDLPATYGREAAALVKIYLPNNGSVWAEYITPWAERKEDHRAPIRGNILARFAAAALGCGAITAEAAAPILALRTRSTLKG